MLNFLLVIFSLLNFSSPSSHAPDYAPAVSHDEWNALLKKYVTENGRVDYKGLKNEKGKLESYLEMLNKNPPAKDWKQEEEMTYWINAYNAFTVKLILDHYPVKSIQEIDGGKPWDEAFIKIGGKNYSLNNIETDFLRKKFSDPRIHFAINCASQSCPRLLNEAFTPEKIELQLNEQTKAFVNDPSRNKIAADNIAISKIFDWYKEDFTKGGSAIDFLNQFSSTRIHSAATITYLNYDWSLNE